MLGAGVAERDEPGRGRLHAAYCTRVLRVYLAGPPFADDYRRRATRLLQELGHEPVDPMRRDFRGRTEGHEQEIVEGDLVDIQSCDAVLADFSEPDEGTAMEAWYAHGLGVAGRRVHGRQYAAPVDGVRGRRRPSRSSRMPSALSAEKRFNTTP